MASTLAPTIAPDPVISFEINPGTLLQFLETRAEGGPRLKCFEGSVTLVSPGMPHEVDGHRLASLILAVCLELGINYHAWRRPPGRCRSGPGTRLRGRRRLLHPELRPTAKKHQPPDLAIEIVVSHPATKALRAGAFLKIPEMWVLDIPRHRLTFHHLATRGKQKGTYRPAAPEPGVPLLTSAEVLERLDDPEADDVAFHENCRAWARRVLVPRVGPEGDA